MNNTQILLSALGFSAVTMSALMVKDNLAMNPDYVKLNMQKKAEEKEEKKEFHSGLPC